MDPHLIIRNTTSNLADADTTIARLLDHIQSTVCAWTPDNLHTVQGGPVNVAALIAELAAATARRDTLRESLVKLHTAHPDTVEEES
ncbi:hypothetical protein [Nocardiopsis sp. LOL_012]|uniref:hypothetical protein n=1 Tax=Nocardiopsis sp. LOL_012 TaxID=3345409 RepID=UPI003A849985